MSKNNKSTNGDDKTIHSIICRINNISSILFLMKYILESEIDGKEIIEVLKEGSRNA